MTSDFLKPVLENWSVFQFLRNAHRVWPLKRGREKAKEKTADLVLLSTVSVSKLFHWSAHMLSHILARLHVWLFIQEKRGPNGSRVMSLKANHSV